MAENDREQQAKISVIVAVYNARKYVEHCISSILKQTYKNIEIIIVNDGSTDETLEIIERAAEKDGRIRCISHEENRGLFQARMTGVAAAAGKYIAFVDSDDSIGVDWLRLLFKKSVETGADIVMGNTICKSDNHNFIYNTPYFATRKEQSLENEEILNYFMENEGMNFSVHTIWNKLYTKELWERCMDSLKKIKENFTMTEDIAFSVVLHYYARKLVYSNHDGYFYYRNQDSSTVSGGEKNKIRKNINDLRISFTFFEEFLKEKNVFEKYQEKFVNWKDRYFRWWSVTLKKQRQKIKWK